MPPPFRGRRWLAGQPGCPGCRACWRWQGVCLCALHGIRLLTIKAEKELHLSALRLLAGSPILGPLPWHPKLARPTVKLGCLRGVPTPRRPKIVGDLEGLKASRGRFPCFFSADVATATAPAAPSSLVLFQKSRREGLMMKKVVGAIVFFYLNWLVRGCFVAKSDVLEGFLA